MLYCIELCIYICESQVSGKEGCGQPSRYIGSSLGICAEERGGDFAHSVPFYVPLFILFFALFVCSTALEFQPRRISPVRPHIAESAQTKTILMHPYVLSYQECFFMMHYQCTHALIGHVGRRKLLCAAHA